MKSDRSHRVLTGVGAIGVVAIVLPFAYGVSPFQALDSWGEWQIALPAFLAVFITVATVRWMRTGRLSPIADGIAYLLATASVLLTLSLYTRMELPPDGLLGWFMVIAPLLVLGYGALVLTRSRRSTQSAAYRPILALQVAYMAHGIQALGGFFAEWQIGAFAVLVTMMVYAIQIDVVRKHGPPPATMT